MIQSPHTLKVKLHHTVEDKCQVSLMTERMLQISDIEADHKLFIGISTEIHTCMNALIFYLRKTFECLLSCMLLEDVCKEFTLRLSQSITIIIIQYQSSMDINFQFTNR